MRPLTRVGGNAQRELPRQDRKNTQRSRTYRATDGFEAIVPESIVERLVQFARREDPRERAGLFAARPSKDEGGEYVLVVGLVPFEGVRATAVQVETNPASEARARTLLRLVYPDAEPGGWAHSHPSWGLFFSGTDRATQRTWSDRNSLGIVVDPTKKERVIVFRGPGSEELKLTAGTITIDTTDEAITVVDERIDLAVAAPAAIATTSPADNADVPDTGVPHLPLRPGATTAGAITRAAASVPSSASAAATTSTRPDRDRKEKRARSRSKRRRKMLRALVIVSAILAGVFIVRRSNIRLWTAVAALDERVQHVEARCDGMETPVALSPETDGGAP